MGYVCTTYYTAFLEVDKEKNCNPDIPMELMSWFLVIYYERAMLISSRCNCDDCESKFRLVPVKLYFFKANNLSTRCFHQK